MKSENSRVYSLGKRQSLPEELAQVIMGQIEAGEYVPGDVLPSELSLGERFKVSRTVVREALARLKYEGIIESKRGSGPIVKGASAERGFTVNLDDLSLEELRDFIEFRVIIEGESAALAAVRRTPAQLRELCALLEQIRFAVEKGTSGTEPDFLFHRLIADSARNPYLGDFVKFLSTKIWLGVYRARWLSNQVQARAQAVYEEHRAIFLAIEQANPHLARESAQRHLRNSANRQGIALEGQFLIPFSGEG